jgi:Flp pilus assembly protein CpaB
MPARAVLALNARLALARYRRLVVAALVGLAVMTGLQVLRPADPPTRDLLVAAHDLPTGHRVEAGDLVTRAWDTRTVPDGVLPHPQGLVLSGPIRRGEPLTDARVVPTGSAAIPAGRVVVTVRLSDPASGMVVHPGERADILAGPCWTR